VITQVQAELAVQNFDLMRYGCVHEFQEAFAAAIACEVAAAMVASLAFGR